MTFWTLAAAAAFLIGPVGAAAASVLAAHNVTFHVTRNNQGDTFTMIGIERRQQGHCTEEICVGASSGTASTATTLSTTTGDIDTCWCQCHPHLPTFREDLHICVDDILGYPEFSES
nr:unnamed protein product [Callosobruchus analis]